LYRTISSCELQFIKPTLDIEQLAFTLNPMRRTNFHSNVEVAMLNVVHQLSSFCALCFAIFANEVVFLSPVCSCVRRKFPRGGQVSSQSCDLTNQL